MYSKQFYAKRVILVWVTNNPFEFFPPNLFLSLFKGYKAEARMEWGIEKIKLIFSDVLPQ